MRRIQFKKDVTSSIEFFPEEGRPDSSASLYLFTRGTTALHSTYNPKSVSLDSVNEALTVAASERDETLTVGSVSGIVPGRYYSVKNEYGQRQEVKVLGANGNTVLLDRPLAFDCAVTTSSLQGHRLATTVEDTHLATRYRHCNGYWEYVVDGVTYTEPFLFDIVFQPYDLRLSVKDIRRQESSFGEMISEREEWKELSEGAIDYVWDYIMDLGVRPDLIRNYEGLKTIAVFRLLVLRLSGNADKRKFWERELKTAEVRFAQSKLWWDSDDDMSSDLWGGIWKNVGGVDVFFPNEEGDGGIEAQGLPANYAGLG